MTSRRAPGGLRRENDPPLLILVSLAEGPKHGHALARDISAFAGVTLGPGALYGAITRLEERGLIEPLASEDRRRPYQITAAGSAELATALDDLRRIASTGTARLGRLWASWASWASWVGPGMTAGERDLSGLLRWYPRAWRQRYGDEFLAMVEDTLDGRRPGWRLHLSVAWAGLRERGRRVVPAALRRMAGTKPPWSLGRVGVATTLLALVIFWSMQNLTWVSLSAGAYRQARGAVTVDVFAGLDVVLGVAVTVSGLVAGPAFVRFLRAGGWPAIRRPVAGAAVLTVVGAVPLIRLFLLARSMTFFEMPGPAAYTIWVVATMVPLGAALLLWRRAVMTVASRLELRPQARAVQIVLNAVAVVAALALPPLVGIWNVQVASDDWVQLSLAVLILFGLWRSAPARLWWAWHQAQQVRAGAAE